MRTICTSLVVVSLLASTPAFALLKETRCPIPISCAAMKTALVHCKKGIRCDRFAARLSDLVAPTKCQKNLTGDQYAFTLCDKKLQDQAFDLVSHLPWDSSKELFCSIDFEHMIARRKRLVEAYNYAFVPYDPKSVDDVVAAERPDYFAAMTDCRSIRDDRH